MADIELVIKIPEEKYNYVKKQVAEGIDNPLKVYIANGTPLTPGVLADALMEERIRGKLYFDTNFEKDVIRDVKCKLTVNIIDRRPCYCGSELREVWRESEVQDEKNN